ncbi:MAG: hypothetical protein QOJ05_982 [Verrucomicrobiota bacterium]|jgi:hypothetical protein
MSLDAPRDPSTSLGMTSTSSDAASTLTALRLLLAVFIDLIGSGIGIPILLLRDAGGSLLRSALLCFGAQNEFDDP